MFKLLKVILKIISYHPRHK